MPADPETMTAIHALAENLRNAVDARLNAHKEEGDRARQRIYERIDAHAKEARGQIDALAMEVRAGAKEVSVQIATLGTELRAHSQYDEHQFARQDRELAAIRETAIKLSERVDGKLDADSKDRSRLWQIIAWVVGATGLGTGLLSKWGGGGQN